MADKSNGLNKGEKTRILLLDTAERLFGQNGVTATSLREVMKVADVNMAMVHYYFKNKDGLLDAILERRLVPINQARLNLLGQYALEAGGQPLAWTISSRRTSSRSFGSATMPTREAPISSNSSPGCGWNLTSPTIN